MAPPITVTIPHRLGKAEARARLAHGFENLNAEIARTPIANFQQAWSGDRLTFHAQALGQAIGGRVDVGDDQVRIEVDLPALLAGFAERIAGRLRQQGRLLLEKK